MAVKQPRLEFPAPIKFSVSEVKDQAEGMWRDRVCGSAFALSVALILVSAGLIGWKYRSLPAQVPLFFSQPWGEAQLVKPLGLLILPGITLVVLFVNGFIGGMVFAKHRLVAKILVVAGAMIGVVTTYALMRIMLLVF